MLTRGRTQFWFGFLVSVHQHGSQCPRDGRRHQCRMVGCKSSGTRAQSRSDGHMRIQRRGQRSTIPVDAMFNQDIPFSKRDSPVVRRRKSRGAQVGGRSRRTWRRETCSRKTSARCFEDGKSPVQSPPCAREDGIMSEVHRTGQEAREEGRGTHHKGHRAKGSVPPGGRGGRRTFEAARVRSSSASSIFGAGGGRLAASDRCIDSGARFFAGDAQSDAGSVVWRRPSQSRSQSCPCKLRIFKTSKCGSAIGTAS